MLTKTILTRNVITSVIFFVVSKTGLKCLQYKYPSLFIKAGRFSSCSGMSGFQHKASSILVFISVHNNGLREYPSEHSFSEMLFQVLSNKI